jgi:uncharacterized protein YuzE
MPSIEITIDPQADAAYIQLSADEVSMTVALTDAVNIDLDQHGCVVGIEVLSLTADIPMSDLTTKYHVKSDVVKALQLIRPSVSTFVTNLQATREVSYAGTQQSVTT